MSYTVEEMISHRLQRKGVDCIQVYYIAIVLLGIAIWFITTYLILSRKRRAVAGIKEQVNMHRKLYLQECGSENEQAAKRMLDTSRFLYEEIRREYNNTINKPGYHFTGYVLGYRILSD